MEAIKPTSTSNIATARIRLIPVEIDLSPWLIELILGYSERL